MFVKDNWLIPLLIVLFFDVIEAHLYERFLIESQSYTKEGEVFRTKSPTECLLRCGKRKCMNAIIEDENCQCTATDCASYHQSLVNGSISTVVHSFPTRRSSD